jgi:hypothetical protein
MPQKRKPTGGVEDIQSGGFANLSSGIGSVFSSDMLRKLAKMRIGDPPPLAKKAQPKLSKSQIGTSAKGLGYDMTKDGRFVKTPAAKPAAKKAKTPAQGHGGY